MSPRRHEPKVVRQEVVWVSSSRRVTLESSPYRIWTLYGEGRSDPDMKPSLPITPQHNHGAFMEDRTHDWQYNPTTKVLRYYSRVTDGDTWILVEYADKNPWSD